MSAPFNSPPAHTAFGRFERPSTDEHAETPEHDPFGLFEQVIAPIDQSPQRLLPRERRLIARPQQPKAIVQPRGDVVDGHRAHARRRELKRQGYAVQATTNLRDRRRILVRQAKRRLRRGRSVDEQPNGFVAAQRRGRACLPLGGRERRQRVQRFAGNA